MAIMINTKVRFQLQAVFDFPGRYIYHDNHDKTEYNRICSLEMDETMRRFLFKMFTMIASVLISLIWPTYAYIAHGIRTTSTSLRIPFTAPNSDAEFIVNVILQTVILGHGAVAYYTIEVTTTVVENAVTVLPRLSTNDLAHTIRQYKDQTISGWEFRCKMNNFLKSACDLDK